AAIERWGRYVAQLAEWREESERRCEVQRAALEAVGGVADDDSGVDAAAQPDICRPPAEGPIERRLDARVRELTAALTRRDLELGRLAEWLQKADAWRRLGFASEAHYVRERMGVSHTQWKLKRLLARRL